MSASESREAHTVVRYWTSFELRVAQGVLTSSVIDVGGNSNVPLGFVSLTKNLVMIGMAVLKFLWAM